MANDTKHPTTIHDLPDQPFYAILIPHTTHHEGDERSRTNPGHGYPAHSTHHWNIETYPTEEKWHEEIKQRISRKDTNFKPVKITPATMTATINVQIQE